MKNTRAAIYPLGIAFILILLAAPMVRALALSPALSAAEGADEGATEGAAEGASATPAPGRAGPSEMQSAGHSASGYSASDFSAPAYSLPGHGLYIVQLTAPPLALYDGGVAGLSPTNPQALGQADLEPDAPASIDYLDYLQEQRTEIITQAEALLGRPLDIAFNYNFAFAGFAAEMTSLEASRLAMLPGVRQVTPDSMRQLHTDVGPAWIGAPGIWDGSATGTASQGEDVIIGVIDTGANIDHPSFADPGPIDGFDYTNPFGAGVFKGLCATEPAQYRCNDKLLGYYIFTGEAGDDTDGHGSHTASTSGGNRVTAVMNVSATNTFSYTAAISGVAPHAHLILYDACADGGGCPLTALAAAIDQAVSDGVDVINYSIGGPSGDPWVDTDSQAFLGAVAAGTIPVASAGNSGPDPATVGSPAESPWVLTVAASTHTRTSTAVLANLSGGASAPPANLKGQGLTQSYGPARIVYAGSFGDPKCQLPFPTNTWTHGEIVVCERGGNARTVKGTIVKKGGAGGIVLINTQADESTVADPYIIPGLHLGKAEGDALKTWLSTGTGHMATIQATQIGFGAANADMMADFSSRGPNLNKASDVIKPDVTAPGVNILAAYRSGSGPAGDAEPWMDEFSFLSGTSMSSPHTAGAAALLSDLHPDWTPMELKSALMTTAIVAGVRKEDGSRPADPFDRGAGRIDVSRAARAGMVFDVSPAQFYAADPAVGGEPAALNLPSLASSACAATCVWTRTARNPTHQNLSFVGAYTGAGSATITPSLLTLGPGQTATFQVTLDASTAAKDVWAFGLLTWSEASGRAPDAHLPLAVKPVTPAARASAAPPALDSDQAPETTVTRTLTIANTGAAVLTWQIKEDATPTGGIVLADGGAATAAVGPDTVPVVLKVDDGRAEWNIGTPGIGQFIWFNRFTPDPATFPIALEKVQVLFELGGVNVGELVDLYVYEDTDGDGNPGTGAVHRASLKNQAVQATDGETFSTYSFPAPVMLNGPGDVLIAVVNRTAGSGVGEHPATLDINSRPRLRSWIGSYSGPPADPPVLPAPNNWGIISDLDFGLNGNWLIRGLGTGRGPCDAPVDVPWLKQIAPMNGSTPPGSSSGVEITFDAAGLAPGEYNAVICIDSNDAGAPRLTVPVHLTVADAPAIQVLPAGLVAQLAPGRQSAQPLSLHNIGGQNLVWTLVETAPASQGSESANALGPTDMLHDQTDHPGSNGFPSQIFTDLNGRLRGADDFLVPAADGGWRIERITAPGLYSIDDGPAPSFDVVIFANDGSLPGPEVYAATQVSPTSDQDGEVVLDLPQPAMLPPGAYWLSVAAHMAFNPGTQQWFWLTREVESGRPFAFENPDKLIPIPQCATWKPGAAVCGVAGGIDPDALFRLEGKRGAPVCNQPGDIGWLSVTPANGVATPGSSKPLQATFDSTGLAPGAYTRSLCFSSNDPQTPYLVVPVHLEVTNPPPKLYLPRMLRP